MTPLKTHWMELYKPITDNLKLDMRMNLKTKKVRACNAAWSHCSPRSMVTGVCGDVLCCCLRCMWPMHRAGLGEAHVSERGTIRGKWEARNMR